MATFNGGDGSQTISGTAGNDIIYGHSAADLNPNSGRITATRIATGLANPVFAGATTADPNGLYALEKDLGRITRIDLVSGAKTTFLDIPNTDFGGGGERGLLGLAFHPDYATNGRFFVFINAPNGDLTVKEYHRSAGNPNLADAAPVQTIITIPHPNFGNHNGGSLAFGPDGMLYISTGDGGSGGDPSNNAQTRTFCSEKFSASTSTPTIFRVTLRRTITSPLATPLLVSAWRVPMRFSTMVCAIPGE